MCAAGNPEHNRRKVVYVNYLCLIPGHKAFQRIRASYPEHKYPDAGKGIEEYGGEWNCLQESFCNRTSYGRIYPDHERRKVRAHY